MNFLIECSRVFCECSGTPWWPCFHLIYILLPHLLPPLSCLLLPLLFPPSQNIPHPHHYHPYIISHSAFSCLVFPSLFLMFSSFFNPLRCSGAHCIHSSLDWYLTTPNLNISYFTYFPFSHPPHIPLSCAALSLPIFPSPPPYPPILTIPVPCSHSPYHCSLCCLVLEFLSYAHIGIFPIPIFIFVK